MTNILFRIYLFTRIYREHDKYNLWYTEKRKKENNLYITMCSDVYPIAMILCALS